METIKIKDVLSEDIRLRNNADTIIGMIQNSKATVLDFSGVKFISRSFADELYSFLENNTSIALINESKIVSDMMNAVKKTHLLGRPIQAKINIGKINSEKELSEFLKFL